MLKIYVFTLQSIAVNSVTTKTVKEAHQEIYHLPPLQLGKNLNGEAILGSEMCCTVTLLRSNSKVVPPCNLSPCSTTLNLHNLEMHVSILYL